MFYGYSRNEYFFHFYMSFLSQLIKETSMQPRRNHEETNSLVSAAFLIHDFANVTSAMITRLAVESLFAGDKVAPTNGVVNRPIVVVDKSFMTENWAAAAVIAQRLR